MSAQTHFNGLQKSCVTRISSVKILIRSTLKMVQKNFFMFILPSNLLSQGSVCVRPSLSKITCQKKEDQTTPHLLHHNIVLPCFPRPSLLLVVLVLSPQHRVVEATESVSDSSLSLGQNRTEGQAMSRGHYKCVELSNKDHRENRTGERLKSL